MRAAERPGCRALVVLLVVVALLGLAAHHLVAGGAQQATGDRPALSTAQAAVLPADRQPASCAEHVAFFPGKPVQRTAADVFVQPQALAGAVAGPLPAGSSPRASGTSADSAPRSLSTLYCVMRN